MTRAGMQELLAELINDPSLLAELRADPEAFASARGAEPEHVHRLGAMSEKQLGVAALVHEERRAVHVRTKFLGTSILLANLDLDELVPSCVADARTPATGPRDYVTVGSRLRTLVDERVPPFALPVVREMLHLETRLYELKVALEGWRPSPAPHPVLAPGVAVVGYGRPLVELRRRLVAGLSVDDLPVSPMHYAVRATEDAQLRTWVLESPLHEVLLACTGSAGPEQIAAPLGLPTAAVHRVLRRCHAAHLVRWDELGSPAGAGATG